MWNAQGWRTGMFAVIGEKFSRLDLNGGDTGSIYHIYGSLSGQLLKRGDFYWRYGNTNIP